MDWILFIDTTHVFGIYFCLIWGKIYIYRSTNLFHYFQPTWSMEAFEKPSRHDDVTKWKHFPRYWPFVGIHRSFDVFYDLRLNKRLTKQWRGRWFETPSRPLWRHWNKNTSSVDKPFRNMTFLRQQWNLKILGELRVEIYRRYRRLLLLIVMSFEALSKSR